MKKLSLKSLLSAVLAGILAGAPASPVLAQEPASPQASKPVAQGGVPISLGVSKYNFTHSPKPFPNIFAPYRSQFVDPGVLANSPRLEQLISNSKMNLSLQDAIALALENSMDIVVQRYNPWIADAGLLKARAGGTSYGTPAGAFVGSTANLPFLAYDPLLTQLIAYDDRKTPINNPFISGTGANGSGFQNPTVFPLISHSATYNTQYQQNFDTGTSFSVAWDNNRASSTAANFFNPYVQSSLVVGLQQQLLAGAGRFINRRNILIAENNRKIADLAFTQQAITTVTSTINAYWELVYARENVNVQEQAVKVSEKLYNDNKKQLEIGTMAPLDVTRAESELATDRQNLIVAQTTRLQDELVVKNFISKDPLASNLINVEIVPTDKPDSPATIQASNFEDAIKEAFAKRPDLQEQYVNLKNADIDVRATKNALLPTATLSAQYGSFGLAGNATLLGPVNYTGPSTVPIFDQNGNPVLVNGVPIFVATGTQPVVNTTKDGFGGAQSSIFHNNFPDYAVSLNLSIPLRNRAAQADSLHAQLARRQLEAQVQQVKNNALLDVRNTTIALEQGRAQVEAASKARELQRQTFDAEQKKYQLGASTVYQVILTQRDLITAQGTELRALANLAEAKANYERALGRTLEINSVTIAGAKKGDIERDTLIPGTHNGQVVGTEELFKALDDKAQSGNR
ncbi:MAG TPA: TolC family protein [Candidatus Limnocylindrales bacterium]|nr:TolC family protein [Candidatus Limnocylindrales bacterium]